MALIIGLDGGGTKTEVLLAEWHASGPPRLLARGASGPSNPQSIGFEAAASAILAALHEARVAAGLEGAEVASACCCLAGAGRAADQQQMLDALQAREKIRHLEFVHDGWAALAAAWPEPMGMALVAGTGSLAFGRTAEGITARVGGWGPLFGDEGSAYDVARRALRAVARAADGRGPGTCLTESISAALGITAPEQLVTAVYGSGRDRSAVAALAPLVFTAAPYDSVAAEIIRATVEQLAEHVVTLASRLRLAACHQRLAMTGGLLIAHPQLAEHVVQQCAAHNVTLAETRLIARPAEGALRLAAAFLSRTASSRKP